ncbi:hypothetical protein [Xenorhabdus bovienii]|uniref:Uncharacterized protein n=1 Tax=Xenorhabdus bovienii str. kraussei Becker Underwood TaxID=1398204 RepID=A0A077PPZ3_XENBV|nr:hypothetical protein [Xenorhabdus bovienii]CDH26380.1 hypothetical protein XBKB1_620001 [Xenorhabdus bovienii str. kraussei Becker Underwood]
MKIKTDIDAELERADALERQKVALIETGDQLQQGADEKKNELSKLQTRLKRQVEINDKLRSQLEKFKNQQENKQIPGKENTNNINDTGNTEDEFSEVDKAASEAITFLESVINLENGNIQELAEIRTKTRETISALNAATVYEENSRLVTDAVNHLSGFLAAIAKSSMAGGK